MKTFKTLSALLAFLSIPVAFSIYGTCDGECAFRSSPIESERGDNRCNIDGDCGPGQECSAFGMCQSCRYPQWFSSLMM